MTTFLSTNSVWCKEIKKHLQSLNSFNAKETSWIPLVVESRNVGILLPHVVDDLKGFSDVFDVYQDRVELKGSFSDFKARTKIICKVIEDLKKYKSHIHTALKGWRNECYSISSDQNSSPLFDLERSACSVLGVKGYGTHMNGFVNHSELGLCLWIATRSHSKPTYPGMLDNMVAGGISSGYKIIDTMVKECSEEAGIPEDLARKAVPVGTINYTQHNERGVKPECQYCFDLEVPEDFQPIVVDGEVEKFELFPMQQVLELLVGGNFKPNSAAVTLDFIIRRGLINPDQVEDYIGIVQLLRCW